MENHYSNTPIGAWLKGIVKLKKEKFSSEEISEINAETSELLESILEHFIQIDNKNIESISGMIEDWFNGIAEMKKAGEEMDIIMDTLGNIKDAFYFSRPESESDDLDEFDDDEEESFLRAFKNFNDDADDTDDYDDDDDDTDDDDDFDPKKFFPKR